MRNAEPQIAVFTLRVERTTLARLKEIADGEHRSLNGELRQMIDERIAAHESRTADKRRKK